MATDTLQAESASTNAAVAIGNAFACTLAQFEAMGAALEATDVESEIDQLADARYSAMVHLVNLPAPDFAGVRAKLKAIWQPGALWNEQEELQAQIMADLDRLCNV
jgi:phosphoenolpyruvate-protein kinase (PTS system EI component)